MTPEGRQVPICPKCVTSDHVRPWSVGPMDNRYPVTVEYECSACGRVFKPAPTRMEIAQS